MVNHYLNPSTTPNAKAVVLGHLARVSGFARARPISKGEPKQYL
jgi:hypothetical protein